MAGALRDNINSTGLFERAIGGRITLLKLCNCLLLSVEYIIYYLISSTFCEKICFLYDFIYIFLTFIRSFAVFRKCYGILQREFTIIRKFPIKKKKNSVYIKKDSVKKRGFYENWNYWRNGT